MRGVAVERTLANLVLANSVLANSVLANSVLANSACESKRVETGQRVVERLRRAKRPIDRKSGNVAGVGTVTHQIWS